jgi:hypothetical protein
LYNSPAGVYGIGGGPVGSVQRFSELALEKNYGSGKKLTPSEANQMYGLDGMLNFDEDIYESAAKLMRDRKMAEYRRDYILQNGATGLMRQATGIPVSIVSSVVDPVNFASMFIPIVGQNRLLSGVATEGLERGLISPRQLAKVVGASRTRMRLATGAIEAGVGQALVEPLVLFPNIYEQSDYGFKDSIENVGAGVILGSGLHLTLGKIGDKFSEIKSNLGKQLDVGNPFRSETGLSRHEWDGIDLETHSDAIKAAIADIVQDSPVTGPSDVIEMSRKAIMEELKWDILNRSREDVAAYHLRQSRQGYDLLVEQYKNQGSRFLWDPEAAKAEVKTQLGGREAFLKIREDLTGQPYRPIDFNEESLVKGLDKALGEAQKLADEMEVDNFFDAGLDDLHPLQAIFKDAEGNKGSEYGNFRDLFRVALKKGYDLTNADVRVGSESVVFITKNRVVKFSTQDLSANEVRGLTSVSEFKAKRGGLYMSASERVKIINESGPIDEASAGIAQAFNLVGKQLGLTFEDAYAYNVGINERGDILLVDTGKIFKTKKEVPKTRLDKIRAAKERTALSAENRQILAKLEQQLKDNNPQITKEMIDAEYERRLKNLIEKKRRQYKSEQKILDNQDRIPEARETIWLGQEVKKEVTPIEPQTPDKIKEDVSSVKEQSVKVENDLRKPQMEADPKKAEAGENYGDFTPEELKIIEAADEQVKKAQVMKKSIENGIRCISGKAL